MTAEDFNHLGEVWGRGQVVKAGRRTVRVVDRHDPRGAFRPAPRPGPGDPSAPAVPASQLRWTIACNHNWQVRCGERVCSLVQSAYTLAASASPHGTVVAFRTILRRHATQARTAGVQCAESRPPARTLADVLCVQVVACGGAGRHPSVSFAVREPSRAGRLHPSRCEALDVLPKSLYTKLKNGESVTLQDGRTIHSEQVRGPRDLL